MFRGNKTATLLIITALGAAAPASAQRQPNCPPPGFPTSIRSSVEPPLASEPLPREEPSRIRPVAQFDPLPASPGRLPPTPVVRVHVHAPAVAPSGDELQYRIDLSNPTRAGANKVRVRATLPKHTTFVTSEPAATTKSETELVWEIGKMAANVQREIRLTLAPKPEAGEVKLCAYVSFEHGQCVRTQLSRPALVMEKIGGTEGVLYEPIPCRIEVKNTGNVPVTDVSLTESLGDGLGFEQVLTPDAKAGSRDVPFTTSEDGKAREWTIGRMRPGETRSISYRLFPKKVGTLSATTLLTGHNVSQRKATKFNILDPKLNVTVTGPKMGFVGQPADYRVRVSNTGTAPLNNVRVTAALPAGVRAAKVSKDAQIFPGEVQWVLTRLEPGETKPVSLAVKASQPGARPLVVAVKADRGLEAREEVSTSFNGVASLNWKTTPSQGAAKVGDQVEYVVEVYNTGSAPAEEVELIATLPKSMRYLSASSTPEVPGAAHSDSVVSFPKRVIDVGAKAVYVLRAEALSADQAKFRFELKGKDIGQSKPLTNEQATTVGGP